MGKKRVEHWAERRDRKKTRRGNDHGKDKEKDGAVLDRRAGIAEQVHPGSYAAQRVKEATRMDASEPSDAKESKTLAPKRRYGMWLAYCGTYYSGLQMNEGVKTIEAELERALFEAGGIAESNYGFLQKVGWSRAGRTDKGVHALGQMLSAKLHVGDDVEAFVATVNAKLPTDIRLLDMASTTKNFHSKLSCDKRTYEYLAPSFIFAPTVATDAKIHDQVLSVLERDDEVNDDCEIDFDASVLEAQRAYRMPAETKTLLDQVLHEFEGTHNFHNFTSKLDPSDPKCKRYIMSFVADAPFMVDGVEWIRLRVIGQSFLLHQIRKMIGMTVAIVGGRTSLETLATAMKQDKMDVPKAPGLGLYLAQAHFEVYNQKLENLVTLPHKPLRLVDSDDGGRLAARVEDFRDNVLSPRIQSQEAAKHSFSKWLLLLEAVPLDFQTMSLAAWKQEKHELSLIVDGKDRVADLLARHQAAASAKLQPSNAETTFATSKDAVDKASTSS